jgi:hypothetical protein
MNCEDVRAAFLAGIDGPVEQAHLRSCSACQAEFETLEAARGVLTSPAVWEEPPPELEDQVVGLITGRRRVPTTQRWFRYAAGIAAGVLVIAVGISLLLNRPDWRIDMTAPTSSNVVADIAGWNTREGTRLAFHAKGLGSAPEGFVYELWFSAGADHVSAGTFKDPSNVRLVVGVTRLDYPHIWVTLEPLDGNPAPSSSIVLETGA